MKKRFPIGRDDFREVIEYNCYYVDKTLLIKDFIELGDKVSLITRPRRFGKTLNMTTLREFFDITKDSKRIFEGLAIMDTEYANQLNSLPVIYFSLKDCRGTTKDELRISLINQILNEYYKYVIIFESNIQTTNAKPYYPVFLQEFENLKSGNTSYANLAILLQNLVRIVSVYYQKPVILLIDEYDQPLLSAVEYGYKDELGTFFAIFYGSALKGNEYLGQALLTGIQRVAKESIFSQLNNINVYTVTDKMYASYFGLIESETETLLQYYDLELNGDVKRKYDGYLFGGVEIYNPWSILNYAQRREFENYWINTSTNKLIRDSILYADDRFHKTFNQLLEFGVAEVDAEMTVSFAELKTNATLWGLLICAGYVTVVHRKDAFFSTVRIPNGEVRAEFQKIVADQIHVENRDLSQMLLYLTQNELEAFMEVYKNLVLTCTSFHDAKENAYHMLFLGMCLSLQGVYKITSNIESGYGRSDIIMQSLSPKDRPHIIIEFKQGEDTSQLKEEALQQILEQKYFAVLKGEILCIGLAHDKKKCEMSHTMIKY